MTSSAVASPLSPAGALLGVASYDPTVANTYTTTSSTMSDVDATNLVVSFTVPASGKVLVRLSGLPSCSTNSDYVQWGLREGSTNIAQFRVVSMASGTASVCVSRAVLITGLTPGAVKSYKWSFGSADNASLARLLVGGTGTTANGPAIMEVHDAAVSPGNVLGGNGAYFLRAKGSIVRTSGDLNAQTATVAWKDLDTTLDITLAAAAGDRAKVWVNGLWGSENVDAYLDCATVVGGSPVNSFGNRGAVTSGPPYYGIPSWRGTSLAYIDIGAPAELLLVSGDISSGTVKLRLRTCSGTNATKTLYASANYFFAVYAEIWAPA